MRASYRRTKIVFTIGPATASEERLAALIKAGAGICRLNMAHAAHDWTREIVNRVRKVAAEQKRQVPIMMDVKGPEIRTGDLTEPIEDLRIGETFDFLTQGTLDNLEDGIRGVTVNYSKLNEDVEVGSTLLVDSGLVRMTITEIREDRVRCEVAIPGPISNRRHVNLPGTYVRLPALTDKDKADIAVGLELDLELYALSFVRSAEDLDTLRDHLRQHGSQARIIAKIEDQSGISNLNDIIRASNGMMVARGDLGIECPFEDLPIIQRRAIKACIQAKKPVIVATHMLESMIEQPLPTRAEVTDVANAVFERADAVMLSGETTVGQYPVECVEAMARIAHKIEMAEPQGYREELPLRTPKSQLLRSAAMLAQDLKAGVMVFTRTGFLPEVLSALRPSHCPIFAFTDNETLYRQMPLMWGIEPFLIDFETDSEATILKAFELLKEHKRDWSVNDGDWMVVVTNVLGSSRMVDSIQMRCVE
ncbi:MAG: pyruvate kinase [Opitutales bacterium]